VRTLREALGVTHGRREIVAHILDRDVAPEVIRPDELREGRRRLHESAGITHEACERAVDIVNEL
jgi:hypothetical protein